MDISEIIVKIIEDFKATQKRRPVNLFITSFDENDISNLPSDSLKRLGLDSWDIIKNGLKKRDNILGLKLKRNSKETRVE